MKIIMSTYQWPYLNHNFFSGCNFVLITFYLIILLLATSCNVIFMPSTYYNQILFKYWINISNSININVHYVFKKKRLMLFIRIAICFQLRGEHHYSSGKKTILSCAYFDLWKYGTWGLTLILKMSSVKFNIERA